MMAERETPEQASPASDPGGTARLQLAATLCARLCHDLAGAAGGLAGLLQMAMEENDREALAAALDCALDLAARLRLLRAAWGEQAELPGSLAALAPGLAGAGRLAVDDTGLDPAMQPAARQLAVGLMMAGAAALPRGGSVTLAGGDAGLSVTVGGPVIAWPDSLMRCAAGPDGVGAAGLSPRDVGFAMLWLQAGRLGLSLRLSGPGQLTATRDGQAGPAFTDCSPAPP
jgi:histidine phosphotransferase ChpT